MRHEQGVVDGSRNTRTGSTAAAGRGDLGRQLIEKGEFGRALLSGVTDPATPQRQTTLIVDPPTGSAPGADARGQEARARDAQRLVASR